MNQKSQYFQLFPELLLRGWEDIKYGLINSQNGELIYLTKPAVNALELAWSGIPLDSPAMLPMYRTVFNVLIQNHCGILTDHFIEPLPEQRMKSASCNYTASIHWSITGRCNMKCRHCYVEAPDAIYGELSFLECVSIMDQMVQANIFSVSLTGGEPLIRSDWKEFYQALKERLISVNSIYTNGLLVTEQWLDSFEKLEKRRIAFSLSFDGIGHHDWLRGRVGMERHTINAIRHLVERGFPVEIETALYKDNLESMPETCELLAKLGIKSWKLSEISNSGAWKSYALEHGASQDELNHCYLQVLECFQQLGRPFSLQIDHRYIYSTKNGKASALALLGDESGNCLEQPVCSCMRLHPYLLPDGTLMPCMPLSNCGLDRKMPNLRNTSLIEILSPQSKFFNFISITPAEMFKREKSVCKNCEYRFKCCGGCRARAYAAGNLYGPDPAMCDYYQKGTKKLFEPFYDL